MEKNNKKLLKEYTIYLQGYYAFSSEVAIVEAYDQREALELAKEFYPHADHYVIKEIHVARQ